MAFHLLSRISAGRYPRILGVVAISTVLAAMPIPGSAEILWSGNYETGDFTQWHAPDDRNSVSFHEVPEYGRPLQYGQQKEGHIGNGDLLSLVTSSDRLIDGKLYSKGPTRGNSNYAAKFRVKSSAHGSEPKDCDDGVCKRRRTELTVQGALPDIYNALDYMDERWISVSHYLPSDWDERGGGYGPTVFQIKPKLDGGSIGPCINIGIDGGSWAIKHGWTDVKNLRKSTPWQQRPEYSAKYPAADGSDDAAALLADFPDREKSQAALADLNKGGWTDWVMHVKFDARGSSDGGEGFLRIWKRSGDDPWVEVLHIVPKKVTVAGLTYDRGICYNSPDGFGIKAGMYMDKDAVWNLDADRVLYNDNIQVGSADTVFAEMSPDGSSPGSKGTFDEAPPMPPKVVLQ